MQHDQSETGCYLPGAQNRVYLSCYVGRVGNYLLSSNAPEALGGAFADAQRLAEAKIEESLALGEFTKRLRIGDSLINQHTVKFSDADKSAATDTNIQFIRTQINLPIGTKIITLSLDDDKKIAESNETNNSYAFTVEVLAKP